MRKEFDLIARDNKTLKGYHWKSVNEKAILCIVHGLGEHKGRYQHVAEFLNNDGISVYSYDQRGHGETTGKRAVIPSYDQLLDDITALIEYVRAQNPDGHIFLFGQSMGGNIVANFILKKPVFPIKGVIIASAWFRLMEKPPSWQMTFGKLMLKIMPDFTQSNKLDPAMFSSDTMVAEAYENDPLVHDKISAKLFFSMVDAGEYALENVHKNKLPLLVMHGQKDPITSPEGSRLFSQKTGCDLEYIEWEGMLHETYNEIGKEQVLTKISHWIIEHI